MLVSAIRLMMMMMLMSDTYMLLRFRLQKEEIDIQIYLCRVFVCGEFICACVCASVDHFCMVKS